MSASLDLLFRPRNHASGFSVEVGSIVERVGLSERQKANKTDGGLSDGYDVLCEQVYMKCKEGSTSKPDMLALKDH